MKMNGTTKPTTEKRSACQAVLPTSEPAMDDAANTPTMTGGLMALITAK